MQSILILFESQKIFSKSRIHYLKFKKDYMATITNPFATLSNSQLVKVTKDQNLGNDFDYAAGQDYLFPWEQNDKVMK